VSVVANVAINVDSRNAVGKLREVQAQSKQTERALGGIAAAVGKLAIAFAGIQAIKFVFTQAAELQTQARSLQILAGSAEKAGKIIKELQDLGAVTPFTSTELIDAAKRLQAFGVEADKVVETTRRLADASGATGAELSGLVTAYGQVQAKGRLQGEELLQFQERGIGLQQELRKMYGMTGEEFQKALEKGQIGAKAVEVALQRLTDVGGKYANGAIAQSDTLNGKLSTLQDPHSRQADQRLPAGAAPATATGTAGAEKGCDDAERAAEEANRLAEQIREQTKAAESLKIQQQGSLAILRSSNDFEKAFVEFSVKRTEIQRRYSELTLASKSDEERKLLTEARALEFKQSSFELQKQIADLTKQATAPLDDIVSKLKDQVAFEREYGELIKNGTNPELALSWPSPKQTSKTSPKRSPHLKRKLLISPALATLPSHLLKASAMPLRNHFKG
jgi:tape measure domain-containing protein